MSKMRITVDNRSPSEVLMDALSLVEGAKDVIIIISKDDCITAKTTVNHQDLKWLLDQMSYLVVADEFGHLDRESSL